MVTFSFISNYLKTMPVSSCQSTSMQVSHREFFQYVGGQRGLVREVPVMIMIDLSDHESTVTLMEIWQSVVRY